MIDYSMTEAAYKVSEILRDECRRYYCIKGKNPKVVLLSESYYYALYQSKELVRMVFPDLEIYYLEGVSVDTVLFPTKGEI